MNDEIYRLLSEADSEVVRQTQVLVAEYLRSQIYHKFTGQPKRGILRRIMPPQELHTLDHWLRLGIPEKWLARIEFENREYYAFAFDGLVFYEIAEHRLDRQDYARRLATRTVQKWEWRMREASRRKTAAAAHRETPGLTTGEQQEAFAYQVFGDLTQRICEVAGRTV